METEAEARHDRIDPWLKSLGWEEQDNRVTRERVALAKERDAKIQPDYGLYLAGLSECVAIVEAKKEKPRLGQSLGAGFGVCPKSPPRRQPYLRCLCHRWHRDPGRLARRPPVASQRRGNSGAVGAPGDKAIP